jgi:hypothetical protein
MPEPKQKRKNVLSSNRRLEQRVRHTPIILCAAIYYDDGKSYFFQPKNIKTGYVICARRHHNCIAIRQITTGKTTIYEDVQGFLTSDDRFVDREEAMKIAIASGQVPNDETNVGYSLISEDLY